MKKKKIKFTQSCNEERFPECCGVDVICSFQDADDDAWGDGPNIKATVRNRACALLATTVPNQKKAIEELKAVGFKPIKKFRGNYGSIITLWFINRKRERK